MEDAFAVEVVVEEAVLVEAVVVAVRTVEDLSSNRECWPRLCNSTARSLRLYRHRKGMSGLGLMELLHEMEREQTMAVVVLQVLPPDSAVLGLRTHMVASSRCLASIAGNEGQRLADTVDHLVDCSDIHCHPCG